eukprot:jgi/Botrbrau1/15812/Bobra.40_1s0001.1
MKGVYSSPDSMNGRVTQQSLFPDNTYGADSGGDPQDIPDLTFQEFKAFHDRFYHPSNARFWFYGDDPPEERLRILANYLDEFDARPVDSTVYPQPLFPEPKKVVGKYAAGNEAGEAPKEFVSLNWVLAEDRLPLETELEMGFLDQLLLGTSASPLRKALNDSGLGEAVIGGGLQDELRQPIFSIGLKGVQPGDAEQVEQLIMSELEKIAEKGFTDTAIEAAVNTIEFALRENNTGSFPRGLSLMLRATAAWIYDKDPIQPLQWREDLARFKARLEAGESIFPQLIKKYLLDNKHRVSVVLQPDTDLAKEQEEQEKQRLAATRSEWDMNAIEGIIEKTRELKERQETPDPPEALTCIPSLELSDIPKEASSIPTEITALGSATKLSHELFTNDILYLEAALSLRPVPSRLIPLVPLFCRSLTQMGTRTESFIELTERLGRVTGGVGISPLTSDVRGLPDPAAYVVISGKAMSDKSGNLLEIFRDLLLTARLDDKARFRQMVFETKAGLESGVIGAGHRFAAKRLDGQRSTAGWLSEQMGGIAYLEFIRDLAKRVDSDWDSVQADLEAIRSALLQRRGALINVTADERTLKLADPHITAFLESLPTESGPELCDWDQRLPSISEALTVPTQVNYVCKAGNLYEDAGYSLKGSAYVISKVIGTSWLWDRVRVVGGAYGGFCDFDSHSGMFTYMSYRDPNLLKTVEVYDQTPDFLRGLEMDKDAMTKAIIGTIGDVDSYQLPDAKGHTAFMRYILGVTDAERQQRREEILATSAKDFKEFAEALEAVRSDKARVVAVTNLERAESANQECSDFFSINRVL